MFAANEALQEGRGGISRISRICGLSRVTITKGIRELDEDPLPAGRVRHPGGGRPKYQVRDPALPGARVHYLHLVAFFMSVCYY